MGGLGVEGLSGYNTESLTVDYSEERVWRLPRSLHAKDSPYCFSGS